MELIKERVPEVTTTDGTNKRKSARGDYHRRKNVNMRRVTLECCFKDEETQETTRRRKHQGGSSVPLRNEEEIT